MRIFGPSGNAAVAAPAGPRRAQAGSFSPTDAPDSARSASAPAALRTVAGIDALIALQGVEDATERRRQAVRRGRLALDALDELKIGLLGGTLTQATVGRLNAAAGVLNSSSGEEALDGVLSEIELRLAVEIAKLAAR